MKTGPPTNAFPMNLTGQLIQVADVTANQRNEMFALMQTYYENMDRTVFDADLDEKQWVIQVTDPLTGAVRGFSTQMLLQLGVCGRPVRALFSGDTIVSREYWTKNPLAQVWGQFALSLIDVYSGDELYWLLISKGYKTYRFLPVFFREFHPRYETPTPARYTEILRAFGELKHATSFDASAGIIRTGQTGCRLRAGVAEISDRRLRDPHVRFFVTRNAGHATGDELCCVAPLTRENFTHAAYRVIGSRRFDLRRIDTAMSGTLSTSR